METRVEGNVLPTSDGGPDDGIQVVDLRTTKNAPETLAEYWWTALHSMMNIDVPVDIYSERFIRKKQKNRCIGFMADLFFGTSTKEETKVLNWMDQEDSLPANKTGNRSVKAPAVGMLEFESMREEKRQERVRKMKKTEGCCGKTARIIFGRGGEPMIHIRLMARFPLLMLFLGFLLPIIAIFVAFNPAWYAVNVDSSGGGFRIRDHDIAIKEDAFFQASEDLTLAADGETQTQQSQVYGAYQVMFVSEDGNNLLTEDKIKYMRSVEMVVRNANGYSDYCLLSGSSCLAPLSMTNYVYPSSCSSNDGEGSTYMDCGKTVSSVCGEIESAGQQANLLGSSYTTGSSSTQFNLETLYWAFPLAGYTSNSDNAEKQEESVVSQARKVHSALKGAQSNDLDIKVLWGGVGLTDVIFEEVLYTDLLWALAALVFVWVYIWFHTRSHFLSVVGTWQIVLSFPACYFFYRVICGFQFLTVFTFLSLFLIFGIGADDLFLLLDSWKQSGQIEILRKGPIAQRMNWAYRRAAKSMLITTTTTAVAFYANAISILPIIREFGVFTGTIVVTNYIMVVTIFPAAIIAYHRYLECCAPYHFACFPHWLWTRLPCMCVCCHIKLLRKGWRKVRGTRKVHEEHPVNGYIDEDGPVIGEVFAESLSAADAEAGARTARSNLSVEGAATGDGVEEAAAGEAARPIESIPAFPIADALPEVESRGPADARENGDSTEGGGDKRMVAKGVVQLDENEEGLRVAVGEDDTNSSSLSGSFDAGGMAANTKPDVHAPPPSVGKRKSRKHIRNCGICCRLCWRIFRAIVCIRPVNGKGEDFDRWLERFFYRVYSPVLYYCRFLWLLVMICELILFASFAVQLGPKTGAEQWMPDDHPIQQYWTYSKLEYASNSDFSVQASIVWGISGIDRSTADPADRSSLGTPTFYTDLDLSNTASQSYIKQICAEMRTRTDLFIDSGKVNCFLEDYETWKTNNGVTETDFNVSLKNFTDNDPYYKTFVGYDSSNIPQWWHISGNVTLTLDASASDIRPMYEAWGDYVTTVNSGAPSSLGTNAYATSELFLSMLTEETLANSALVGTLVSLALAFSVITCTTRNIVIGVLAVLVMISTVVSALGIMVMLGWTLGTIESVCITILVGISVDYVLHIANSYNEALENTRFKKIRSALTEMGISIFSAAVTTFISSCFLLFTTIIFFFKFGLFIAFTIFFSTLYSFLLFPTLVAIIGPVRAQGNLLHYAKLILYYCCNDCRCLRNCKKRKRPKEDQVSVLPEEDRVHQGMEVANQVAVNADDGDASSEEDAPPPPPSAPPPVVLSPRNTMIVPSLPAFNPTSPQKFPTPEQVASQPPEIVTARKPLSIHVTPQSSRGGAKDDSTFGGVETNGSSPSTN